ncbi:MAG: diacylglycerol kinase family protein [Myxococcota bacterium]
MTHLLVGNPTAQSGKAAKYLAAAEATLQGHGVEVERLATEPDRRTVGLVRDAIDRLEPKVVIAFGGDGTFNEVASGILESGRAVPLGMLPMGTANNQGRSFGLKAGPDALADNIAVIVAGFPISLDAGRIQRLQSDGAVTHEMYFFDSVGWGMQPDILAQRNRDRAAIEEIPVLRDLWRDQAVYASATVAKLLESYVEPTKFRASIVADGQEHHYEGLTDLVISNTALYAGEWVVDRDSEPDDGWMELAPFQGRRDWMSKTIRDLAALKIRQEDLDAIGVTHSVGFRGRSFELELTRFGREEIAAQVDGEEWHAGHRYRVDVIPSALPLITPEGFRPTWR